MKTEGNEIKNNLTKNEGFLTDRFIIYINMLSDSIKEYYKVSTNTIKNKNILINSLEEELSHFQGSIPTNILISLTDIINNIKLNLSSSQNNLMNFFEDGRIIFKEMKEYKNSIKKKIEKQNSIYGLDYQGNEKTNISARNIKNNNYQHSEMNMRIDRDNKGITNINRPKSTAPNRYNINEPIFSFDSIDNNGISVSNDILEEMEKLKKINKNYQLKIKKLNLELEKFKNYNNNSNFNKNDNNIKSDYNELVQEELTINKDKLISSLKEELEKSNKKNAELFKNFKIIQNQFNNLKEQNNIQRKSNPSDKALFNRLNELTQENNKLKLLLESIRSKSDRTKSDYNYKVNFSKMGIETQNQNWKNEIAVLKNKIVSLEKKLNEEKLNNKKLRSENDALINKHSMEMIELSKGKTQLSEELIKKQKDLVNLQKQNLEKMKEIENLKISINSRSNEEKNKLLESFISNLDKENNIGSIPRQNLKESANRILENYQKENEQLKLKENIFMEKIKNLEKELQNIKNINMEIENKNKKQLNDLSKEYGKKISEMNNKNIDILNELNLVRKYYNNLANENRHHSEVIGAKEQKILILQIQNNQMKEELDKVNNLKISKQILNDSNMSNVQNQFIDLKKNLKMEIKKNDDLKEELAKTRKEKEQLQSKLLQMGIKCSGDQECQLNRDEIIEELNEEIERLKQSNQTLRDMVDSFNYLKNSLHIQNEKKDESTKNGKENLEVNEQIIKKYEGEIEALKKENEKLTNKIIELSCKLPEEFNEVQKQYNDLEKKYKQLLKSEKKNNSNNNINNNINNININNINNNHEETMKLMKELNNVKKENEEIKKKNLELISQLEEKEIKKNCFDIKSEDGNFSNYEEEFDLRKMAKGAKEKNRSQDINIDYPGIQNIKEKYRELNFYYNSLEGLVKKLLATNIQVNQKNKVYVSELCKIVGFDSETTNKILNNKNKNLLLGLFTK